MASLRLLQLTWVFHIEFHCELKVEFPFGTLELVQKSLVRVKPKLRFDVSFVSKLEPEILGLFDRLRVENIIQQDISFVLGLQENITI